MLHLTCSQAHEASPARQVRTNSLHLCLRGNCQKADQITSWRLNSPWAGPITYKRTLIKKGCLLKSSHTWVEVWQHRPHRTNCLHPVLKVHSTPSHHHQQSQGLVLNTCVAPLGQARSPSLSKMNLQPRHSQAQDVGLAHSPAFRAHQLLFLRLISKSIRESQKPYWPCLATARNNGFRQRLAYTYAGAIGLL